MAGETTNRIAGLDGWRGIAILLVLFDHVQDSLLRHYVQPWAQTGPHGVTIFFVLSGFLITSKLLEGPINLKRFYVRRFFRLMPAAWTYLATLAMLTHFTRIGFASIKGLIASLFFYRNFSTANGLDGHFWSLSMEEQFYLVWPCVLLISGKNRARWIAAAGACGIALYRWFFWSHYNNNFLGAHTQVRADSLLVGCLLALLVSEARFRPMISEWSRLLRLPALAVLLLCMLLFHGLTPLSECIAIGCLIVATALHPTSTASRALSFRPLAWLGTVSYSVYIWQEFFMQYRSGLVLAVCIPICALGSYYLIEKPSIAFGSRFCRNKLPAQMAATTA